MKPADLRLRNDPPDDDNPYRSPGTTRPSRKTDWPAIIARCIGLLLIVWAVFRYFEHGIIEIGLLSLAAMLTSARLVCHRFGSCS